MFAVFSLFASWQVMSDETKDLIKYRKGLMNSSSISVRALFNFSRDKLSLSMESVQQHADIIYHNAQLLDNDLATVFPEGSIIDGETSAKAVIWERWPDFSEKSKSYVDAAETFRALVNTNPSKQEIMNGFRKMRKACGSCHRRYKADD